MINRTKKFRQFLLGNIPGANPSHTINLIVGNHKIHNF